MFSQANKKKAVVGFSGSALHLVIELASVPPSGVRMSANKVVAGVRCAADLPNIHPQHVRQSASTHQFTQLEGLAIARSWRFESSLPHQPSPFSRSRQCRQATVCGVSTTSERPPEAGELSVAARRVRGRVKINMAPPAEDSAQIRPPCASTIPLAI